MAGKKDPSLEAMRWMCILAVVCHHGISLQRHSPETVAQIRVLQDWLQWCVAGFFLVSGYLQPLGRPLASQFLGRARRLLVPYLAVSLLAFGSVSVLHHSGLQAYPEPETLNLASLAAKLVWLAGFGPQLYFLPYLLLAWVLVVPSLRWIPPRWAFLPFLALLAAQTAFWTPPLGILGPGLDKLAAYALAFSLGVSLRAREGAGEGRLVLFSIAAGAGWSVSTGQWWALSLAFPTAMRWALARLPVGGLVGRLQYLGSPGGIYLWHAPLVLPACSKVLGMVGILDWPNYLLSCGASCVVALVLDRFLASFRATRWLTL